MTDALSNFSNKSDNAVQPRRNYELDFIKLVFSVFVFLCHANVVGLYRLPQMGDVAVHAFFVISGLLMACSISKKNTIEKTNCGKASIGFVLGKFKAMSWPVWTGFIINFAVVEFSSQQRIDSVVVDAIREIPEFLLVHMSGGGQALYNPIWYLSAMLIVMLPLAYMLFRNKDFTCYVFAPLAAILSLGYLCQTQGFVLWADTVINALIRAFCGLCFGICSFTIYDKIKDTEFNTNMRALITVFEIFLYFCFFYSFVVIRDKLGIIAVLFLLPIAFAITFSAKSFVSRLFNFRFMKCFAPLSLYIYLNHWVGRVIAKTYFKHLDTKSGIMLMAGITAVACLLNFLITFFGKKLWEKKLKYVLTKK